MTHVSWVAGSVDATGRLLRSARPFQKTRRPGIACYHPKVASENTGGPYLVTAVFCERVLQERDGVLSLIRVVDRWNIAGPSETMPTTSIQTVLCLSFKSGIFRGPADVTVTPISPDGNRLRTFVRQQVNFEGDDDRGVNLNVNMSFPVAEPGLYWFEIAVRDEVLTRTPLRVLYQRTGSQPPPRQRH